MNNSGTVRVGSEDITYVGFDGTELQVLHGELILQQQQLI